MKRSSDRCGPGLAGLALAALAASASGQGSFGLARKLVPLASGTTAERVGRRVQAGFGRAVAASGPYAAIRLGGIVVGRPDRPEVRVHEDVAGALAPVATLHPSFPDRSFGSALDLDGTTLAVGSPTASELGPFEHGAVEVVERDPATGAWEAVARLYSPTPQPGAFFGSDVAVDGDVLAVGASREDDRRGAIWIFTRSPGSTGPWEATQRVQLPVPANAFGQDLDLRGDTLAAFAFASSSTGGTVHLFERTGPEDDWAEKASFFTNTLRARISVGDGAVVFSDRSTQPLNPPGLARLAERDSEGSWAVVAQLQLLVSSMVDQTRFTFGADCSIDGDTVVVGSDQFAPGSPAGGGAFVFRRGASGTWALDEVLRAPGATYDDGFGLALALAGDTLLVAAPDDDDLGARTGSVFVWRR